jgi:hypothetical protein
MTEPSFAPAGVAAEAVFTQDGLRIYFLKKGITSK